MYLNNTYINLFLIIDFARSISNKMAEVYNFIEDIAPMKESMTIKIRVIRLWKPPSFNNPNVDGSIEMVLLDEKVRNCSLQIYNLILGTLYKLS